MYKGHRAMQGYGAPAQDRRARARERATVGVINSVAYCY